MNSQHKSKHCHPSKPSAPQNSVKGGIDWTVPSRRLVGKVNSQRSNVLPQNAFKDATAKLYGQIEAAEELVKSLQQNRNLLSAEAIRSRLRAFQLCSTDLLIQVQATVGHFEPGQNIRPVTYENRCQEDTGTELLRIKLHNLLRDLPDAITDSKEQVRDMEVIHKEESIKAMNARYATLKAQMTQSARLYSSGHKDVQKSAVKIEVTVEDNAKNLMINGHTSRNDAMPERTNLKLKQTLKRNHPPLSGMKPQMKKSVTVESSAWTTKKIHADTRAILPGHHLKTHNGFNFAHDMKGELPPVTEIMSVWWLCCN